MHACPRLALTLTLTLTLTAASSALAHVPPRDPWRHRDAPPPDYLHHGTRPDHVHRTPITRAIVRAAMAGIDTELLACARDATRAPRALRVHLFWYPTGAWVARVGHVASPPLADEPTQSPLVRCVTEHLRAAIGSELPPFPALAARHLVHVARAPRPD